MLEKFSTKLFGELIKPYLGYFDNLQDSLKRVRSGYTLKEYMSMVMFFSLIVFVVSVIMGSIFITLFLSGLASTASASPAIYSYTLGIILSFVFSGVTFFIGIYYPTIQAKSKEARINRSLPFTVSYMATSASSGMMPTDIFKVASLRGGVLGKEAERIYTNVRSLGMSLTDAMQKSAERSPSRQLADLLYGMTSVINSGGRLDIYLRNKTKSFMAQYRRMLQDYARSIQFYTEIYITLVIVGSLFFIVLTAILSPLSSQGVGDIMLLQTFLVYFFMPLVSVGFIVLLKGISPDE